MQQQQILLPTLPYLWPKLIWHLLDKVHPIRKLHCNFARYVVLHQLWINQASSRLEHVWKPKFRLEHARALKNSTSSSFCPGIWPKMHYFCQNLSIFKGCIASSMKKSSIERARACSKMKIRASGMLNHQKLASDGHKMLNFFILDAIQPLKIDKFWQK